MRRGTTLVELMVSVGFLGLGAVTLLACVNESLNNEAYARRRARILAAAQDVMDTTRATAHTGTVATGVTTKTIDVTGLQTGATITQTVTLQTGYSDLYEVNVTATWNERPGIGQTRADSIVLDTFVRAYDT